MVPLYNRFDLLCSLTNNDHDHDHDRDRDRDRDRDHLDNDNLLSALPHDILSNIFSLLPLQSALTTNLLSTRWQCLWITATSSVINGDELSIKNAILKLIESFDPHDPRRSSWSFRGPQWRAQIGPGHGSATQQASPRFLSPKTEEPPCMFHLELKTNPESWGFVNSASFVKTLCLKSVTCVTHDLVSSLVSLFHCLESLTITKCCGLESLTIVSAPRLMWLTVSGCVDLVTLQVRAQKLRSFRFRGMVPSLWVESFVLADALLDFRKGTQGNCSECRLPVRKLETLTMNEWTFKGLIYPGFANGVFCSLKSLCWIEYSGSDSREALMFILKHCPALEQLFLIIDPRSNGNTSARNSISWESLGFTGKLEHIKVVVLEGFGSLEEELLMAEQLIQMVRKVYYKILDNVEFCGNHGRQIREEAKIMVEPHTSSAAMDHTFKCDGDDLISKLPDEILSHIISMLPLQSGVQTSFLSTRWRGLWNMTLLQRGDIEHATTAVPSFLANFDELDPSRNNRRLQFCFGEGNVLLATIAPKNKLLLDFSTGKKEFELPLNFGLDLDLNDQNPPHQPCSSTFFVKTLHLISVNHLSSEAVSSVLSSFQFLESLKIAQCIGMESLYIASCSKLHNLTIFDCPQLKYFYMSSPKLKTFLFRGLLPWFCPASHFNLEDAMLDFRQGPSYDSFKSSEFDPVLLTIKNAKTLTLCKWSFQALIEPSLSSLLADFQFYRLKELWWIDDSKQQHDSDALISFLKICPALERLFITIDPRSYSMPRTGRNTKKVTSQRQLEHLKVVELEGFASQEDMNSLLRHLQVVFTKNPPIIRTSDEHFQQEIEAMGESWPKHPHMHL